MSHTSDRRRVQHICPGCGQIRHLQPADALATKYCRRCHCKEIAPLGFAATAKSKGRDFAIRAAAEKRKLFPSSLEKKVEAALGQIPGIAWEREYAVERAGHNPYFVDFAVFSGKRCFALEVNGEYVHRHDDPAQSLRLDTLFLFFDDVIVLTEADVCNAPDLSLAIQNHLF